MEPKQDTIGNILESEKLMVLNASDKYDKFFVNAAEINHLLNDFIKSVDIDRYFFAIFLSQIRKYHTLALFSAVRLHRIQTGMDLRQVLEAGSWAAFAIANTEKEKFYKDDANGYMEIPEKLNKQKNSWLEKNFPDGSKVLKRMKENINNTTAHSNIIYAHNNFKAKLEKGKFESPFFDYEDVFHVKTDLWEIANIGYGLMDLFYGVNKKFGGVKFTDNFLPRIRDLIRINNSLKLEMMQSPRMKRIKNL